jgi:hypothetical protein
MPGTPRKSPGARCDGYRAHVAVEPGTGIITDEALTKASGPRNSGAAVAQRFLDAETTPTGEDGGNDAGGGGGACEWYGDSAYGTGDLRKAIGDAGHRAVIKPKWAVVLRVHGKSDGRRMIHRSVRVAGPCRGTLVLSGQWPSGGSVGDVVGDALAQTTIRLHETGAIDEDSPWRRGRLRRLAGVEVVTAGGGGLRP